MIVLSGSMSPSIPAGSLALTRSVSATELHTGDVVTVAAGDKQVTHRIVAITRRGDDGDAQLRGDANARPDEQLAEVRSAPTVVASVPQAGRVIAWLSRTPGVFVLAGYAAFLLTMVRGRSGDDGQRNQPGAGPPSAARPGRHRGAPGRRLGSRRIPRHLARGLRRVAAGLVVLGLGAVSASPARAAWGDTVPVSGSTVATYTVPVPATFTCGALGVRSVVFHWTAVPGATSYTLHYGTGGAQTKAVTGTTTTVTATIVNGTAWLQANRDFGATIWTSAPSATRTYTVAVVSLCS